MSASRPGVLLLSSPIDPTADLVITALQRRRVPVARFDAGEFPAAATLSARLGGSGSAPDGRRVRRHKWETELLGAGGRIPASELGAVYYRRPGPFTIDEQVAAAHRPWCEGQARYGFWGVLESMDLAWINYPPAVAAAEYKPRQLAAALDVGLDVPDTLITNEPTRAAAFAAEHPHGIVTKALYSRGPRDHDNAPTTLLYTSLVPPQRTGEASIGLTAHLFQQFVPKAYDVRVTVVDDHLFAAAIHDSDPDNVTDWRRSPHGLTYRPCTVPDDIARKVRALNTRFGLRFAALDFLVTPDDTWIYVETNPNGQWAWIEHETGLPIADALADALAGPASAPTHTPTLLRSSRSGVATVVGPHTRSQR